MPTSLIYPRTKRGGSRQIYWRASASASASDSQPPFSRAPAPAPVLRPPLMAAASRCSRGVMQCNIQPSRGYANIKGK